MLTAATSYTFGSVDTAAPGTLITFSGSAGFSLGTNIDSMIASYQANAATLGGAGLNDRIIDFSANGNTLVGRDGNDILLGGAGNDTLDGDRGFSAGGNDFLTGGAGNDTFSFGAPFTGATPLNFGNDTVTDFEDNDVVKLFTGLAVSSGLGTTTVTIKSGSTTFGTIFSANGRVWVAGDFT